jgi:hypothetical protein
VPCSLEPCCFKGGHKVLLLATVEKLTELVPMAAVGKVARIAVRAPGIEEAVGHLGASLVSFQL